MVSKVKEARALRGWKRDGVADTTMCLQDFCTGKLKPPRGLGGVFGVGILKDDGENPLKVWWCGRSEKGSGMQGKDRGKKVH